MSRFLVPPTVVAVLVVFAPGRAAAEPKHPHMHHALHEMREAHKELKEAKHDFGGHREKALHDVHAAIVQVEKALEGADDAFKGYTPEKGIYDKYKNHPHLHHALHEMRLAHKQLKEASHNFGGHREKALHDLHAAIVQTEKCIEFIR